MQIEKVSFNSYDGYRKPSFGAIHPVRYFVKCEDGYFHKVVNTNKAKDLQRKLVGWLNKAYDETTLAVSENVQKQKKDHSESALRKRFVRFFLGWDKDYARNKVVRSFYTENSQREVRPYIISGDMVSVIDNEAKQIGRVKRDLKLKKETISYYYGVDMKNAEHYLSSEDKLREINTAKAFHDSINAKIDANMSLSKPENTMLDVYFVPYTTKKNLVKYNLVDAKFIKI